METARNTDPSLPCEDAAEVLTKGNKRGSRDRYEAGLSQTTPRNLVKTIISMVNVAPE